MSWETWNWYNIKVNEDSKPDELFDVHEAARRLNCSVGRVRKLVRDKRIEPTWIGKLLRFSQASLEEFLSAQRFEVQHEKVKPQRRRQKLLPNVEKRSESETPTRADIKKLWS